MIENIFITLGLKNNNNMMQSQSRTLRLWKAWFSGICGISEVGVVSINFHGSKAAVDWLTFKVTGGRHLLIGSCLHSALIGRLSKVVGTS